MRWCCERDPDRGADGRAYSDRRAHTDRRAHADRDSYRHANCHESDRPDEPRAQYPHCHGAPRRSCALGGRLLQIFDPTTGVFSLTGSMTDQRVSHTATLLPDDRVLIAGGFNGTADVASAELYNPVSRTFSPIVPGT